MTTTIRTPIKTLAVTLALVLHGALAAAQTTSSHPSPSKSAATGLSVDTPKATVVTLPLLLFATYQPPLDGRYAYQISAAWHAGGKLITQERTVNVEPGVRVAVDFNPERLPAPK